MRNKSEAVEHVRTFVSQFKALRKAQGESQLIGTLHTDNAGEFLSYEFSEFINQELIARTRCPAHVH